MACGEDGDYIERVGKARYAEIRAEMEAEHWGKMVVIDVHSGDYEIGSDDLTASMRLLERRPEAMTWGERVGYPAAYFFSWHPLSQPGGPSNDLPNSLPADPGNGKGEKEGKATPCNDDDGDYIERVGKARYAEIRAEMEAEHWGKMVVIDVHSGDYEIDSDDLTASMRLLERRPEAMTWGERVGYPAAYFFSWRPNILPLGPDTDLRKLLPADPGNGKALLCPEEEDDDISRIGKARYEELRPQLEAEHWGKMVVIDVNSGDYEIGDGDCSASRRLYARRPEAVTWGERVGYPAAYYMQRRPQILPFDPNRNHRD